MPICRSNRSFQHLSFTSSLLLTLLSLTLGGCGGSGPNSSASNGDIPNNLPVADAGSNQNVKTNSRVTVDGSGSSDIDGDSLSFSWTLRTKPASSSVSIINTTSTSFSFTPDQDGTYVFELVVNDGTGDSNTDQVTITSSTTNSVPIANAGADQNINLGTTVFLDGSSSSDADGDALSYYWTTLSRPSGSSISLNNNQISQPSFTPDLTGNYVFGLTVNDGVADSTQDSVSITVTSLNSAPVAEAGPDQNVMTGSSVSLDGGESSDANGDSLSFQWSFTSQPSGSTANLSSSSSGTPSFIPDLEGTYIVQLIVHDGIVSSAPDTVSIVSSTASGSNIDNFDGSNSLLTTSNNTSALPDISFNSGRYLANLNDNTDDITLHYNSDQGRLDAALVSFPFEFIARNIGIAPIGDPTAVYPPATQYTFNFAGIQVHTLDLDRANSSHVVVGHRGSAAHYTIEGKNTLNGASSVDDNGDRSVPSARADLRIVGNSDRTLTVYWQQPGTSPDNWQTYGSDGSLPGSAPSYGAQVYVGLITYAYGTHGVPFSGVCDSIEIVEY